VSPRPLPLRTLAEVVANGPSGGAGRLLRLDAGAGWPGSEPGQFVMLSAGPEGAAPRTDPLLPRPMAVFRSEGATLDVLYKVVGRGTALLAAARPGERVGLVGPLGTGFALPRADEWAVLVGGGTGIASLFDLAGAALANGARVTVLLGARCEDELLAETDFRDQGVELRLATEDGSAGSRGLVTSLLEAVLREPAGVRVYACGPTPMMRAAAELAASAGRPCHVSLENRMACGYGVCLGCAVPRASGGFELVCRDGPVFDAGRLAWEGVP
jgi:dihydroorotate dehydrogenase electron transfer subunit